MNTKLLLILATLLAINVVACTDKDDGADDTAAVEADTDTDTDADVDDTGTGPTSCDEIECGDNATCDDSSGTPECACDDGYTGDGETCDNIDECADGTAECDAGYTCTDTDGAYTCDNIDECADGTAECDAGYTCTDTDGAYTCDNIDECAEGTAECDDGFGCTDTEGSFTCDNIDECAEGTDDCTDGYACADTEGSYTCDNIDECADGTAECDDGYDCEDTEGSFECVMSATVLYAADGRAAVPGSLYRIEVTGEGATSTTVAPLTHAVTGLAFAPDGTLFATECTAWDGDAQLLTIDTTTGEITEVGELLDDDETSHPALTDISFVGSRLIGWSEEGDVPVEINTATGAVTVLSDGGDANTWGTGLASMADGTLYLLEGGLAGDVYEVETSSGEVTLRGSLVTLEMGDYETSGGATYADGLLYSLSCNYGEDACALGVVDLDAVTYTSTGLELSAGLDSLASQ